MAICQNTLFDLLRNSFLIPYRFNADGRTNPIIMTDESGNLLPGYKTTVHEKITSIFMMSTVILTIRKIFILHRPTVTAMPMLLKNGYGSADSGKNTGVLIIRELPDTVKLKETEAEAYSAVWDLMIKLEKSLPMAYIFYGQDSLVEENTRYDEIGIFLPDSLF